MCEEEEVSESGDERRPKAEIDELRMEDCGGGCKKMIIISIFNICLEKEIKTDRQTDRQRGDC